MGAWAPPGSIPTHETFQSPKYHIIAGSSGTRKAASSAFGRLTKRVFLNHNLAIPTTKVAVYRAVCVSVMLYGCETWTL